jgi:hypothetical protein
MKIFLIPLMIGAVTGMMAVGMLANMVFAQGTDTAATTSGVYVTVVLAVISLVNSLFSTYLAQKAKMTGQAPNETDLRIKQQLVLLQ